MESNTTTFLGLMLILVGLLVRHAKWYFLMAGYNTMSKDEKENHDIEAMATFFRNVLCVMGLLLILGDLLANYLKIESIAKVFFFVAIVGGTIALIALSNSDRFKK